MITGVVLARNEERNIVACLSSLRPHVAELLLIDMDSGDRTVELARPYVDKVLAHPLVANFDSARNIAIGTAQYDWQWYVDADERVSLKTGQLVGDIVRRHGHEFEAITIPFKTYFCGKWIEHCGWWPGYTMPRVLKRGHFQFATKLHGGVEVSGRSVQIPPDEELAIEHLSYLSVEHYLDKFNRYTSTEAQQLAAAGAQFDWRAGIRDMTRDLWVYYERNRGNLDGAHGWVLSWLSGQYRWAAQGKLLDLATTSGAFAPRNLDEVCQLMEDELAHCRASAPQLPLGIVWRSPIWDPSGYAEESRHWLKALSTGDRPLAADEIPWSDRTCSVPSADGALFRALLRGRRPTFSVALTNCIPTVCGPDSRSSFNILRTTFETDRIPPFWLSFVAHFDEVWVLAEHNRVAFRRSGVPPEKIQVVPSCIDTFVYSPEGDRLELGGHLGGRFVFLSVFDWQLRKGWDVLTKAFCREFRSEENVALLLKITTAHGHTSSVVRQQLDQEIRALGERPADHANVVIWDDTFETNKMAALYRSVGAFVLASRGEGWGRPYMEAMASGLPTIGTRGSGNMDFMDDENSFLVSTEAVQVPENAAREIPVYFGHRWQEPKIDELQAAMRQVYADSEVRAARGRRARQVMVDRFSLTAGRQHFERQLVRVEERFQPISVPDAQPGQIRVELEGEFFAAHSFANINEQVARGFSQDESLALSLKRVRNQPTYDAASIGSPPLLARMDRPFAKGPEITIRHAFPPNFVPPANGQWVHIQPWEFGHLPKDWIQPLQNHVDEIWVPSEYVRRVYERSGVAPEKIQRIPWGIDPEVFTPEAPPLFLPTDKTFAFLFVGGTIPRKGFDTLLEAFLAEFRADEDVCLVVKDMGTSSFYQFDNCRQQALAAATNIRGPKLIYIEELFTPGQLASLYTACQCLVAPYRGEGFGLPVLEAMACGLAVIVPSGGASDDFVSPDTAWLLDSREVSCEHSWQLCGTPLQLEIDRGQLQQTMRKAFESRDRSHALGQAASQVVRSRFTWRRSIEAMVSRIHELHAHGLRRPLSGIGNLADKLATTITAGVVTQNAELCLADCLARVRPFVDEILVYDKASDNMTRDVAIEYGARVVAGGVDDSNQTDCDRLADEAQTDWLVLIDVEQLVPESTARSLRRIIAQQPADVDEFEIDFAKEGKLTHSCPTTKLRFFRRGRSAAVAATSYAGGVGG